MAGEQSILCQCPRQGPPGSCSLSVTATPPVHLDTFPKGSGGFAPVFVESIEGKREAQVGMNKGVGPRKLPPLSGLCLGPALRPMLCTHQMLLNACLELMLEYHSFPHTLGSVHSKTGLGRKVLHSPCFIALAQRRPTPRAEVLVIVVTKREESGRPGNVAGPEHLAV